MAIRIRAGRVAEEMLRRDMVHGGGVMALPVVDRSVVFPPKIFYFPPFCRLTRRSTPTLPVIANKRRHHVIFAFFAASTAAASESNINGVTIQQLNHSYTSNKRSPQSTNRAPTSVLSSSPIFKKTGKRMSTPAAQFRAKTNFMKTWRPSNPPSVRLVHVLISMSERMLCSDSVDWLFICIGGMFFESCCCHLCTP